MNMLDDEKFVVAIQPLDGSPPDAAEGVVEPSHESDSSRSEVLNNSISLDDAGNIVATRTSTPACFHVETTLPLKQSQLTAAIVSHIETPAELDAGKAGCVLEQAASCHKIVGDHSVPEKVVGGGQSSNECTLIDLSPVSRKAENLLNSIERQFATSIASEVAHFYHSASLSDDACETVNIPNDIYSVDTTAELEVRPLASVDKSDNTHGRDDLKSKATEGTTNIPDTVMCCREANSSATTSENTFIQSIGKDPVANKSTDQLDKKQLGRQRDSSVGSVADTKIWPHESAIDDDITVNKHQELGELTSQISARFANYLGGHVFGIRDGVYYESIGLLLDSLCDFICSEFVLRQELANSFSSRLRGLSQLRFSIDSHELRCLESLQRLIARHFHAFLNNCSVSMFHRRLRLNFLDALKEDAREELEFAAKVSDVDSEALELNLSYVDDMLKCTQNELHEMALRRCSPLFDMKLHQKEAATKLDEKRQRFMLSKFRSALIEKLRQLSTVLLQKRDEFTRCRKNMLQPECAALRFSATWQTLRKAATEHGELMNELLKYVEREVEYMKSEMLHDERKWNRHSLTAQVLIAIAIAMQKLVIERFRHLKLVAVPEQDRCIDAANILLPETCAARVLAIRKMADFYSAAKHYASLDWDNEVRHICATLLFHLHSIRFFRFSSL